MSQSYQPLVGTDTLTASRTIINNDFDALLTSFSGTAFPTLNIGVGMSCFRTDQNKVYRLRSTGPAVWQLVEDLIKTPLWADDNLSALTNKPLARTNLGVGDGHLPGLASNVAASAGEVGEVITAAGTSAALTSGATTALGSISLGAGDWDISATFQFNASGGTTVTDYNGAVSLTSASLTPHGPMVFTYRIPSVADHSKYFGLPPSQALINATTNFYINARAVFGGTAPTVTWSLRARRMR